MPRKPKVKTVDITVKEWFDKTYGNSYFGGLIVINYGMKTEKLLIIPFQYGYGDQYRHEALTILEKEGLLSRNDKHESYWRLYERLGIIARHTKHENCLKREVLNYIND